MDENIQGRNILITGATSGIGRAAALRLAGMGAKVIVPARNTDKGTELINQFHKIYHGGRGTIETIHCDLSSFQSVSKAAQTIRDQYGKLDFLINNAGVYNRIHKTTSDGIEETFQVNVLSQTLLIHLLGDLIIQSNGRIINTTSSFHHGFINFNDIEGRKHYSGFNAYRQSKLSIILLSKIIAQKLKGTGAVVYCQHPGVVRTNLGKSNSKLFNAGLNLIGSTPEKGAETLLYIATTPKQNLSSGSYYAYKKIWKTKPQSNNEQMARELFLVVKTYLSDYLTEPSFLFQSVREEQLV